MPQLKPKKPKHHQQHKPKKKKKLKHHGPGHGKPNPEHPRRKRGKKPQKPFHLKRRPPRSGSIPRACRRLIGEAKLLDCWLDHNPDIANAIVWQPAPGTFDTTTVAWPAWTPAMKAELRKAWMDARAWHAGGMTGFNGTAFTDPPPNQDDAGGNFRTLFHGWQAWPIYLAQVAHSLAAEIEAWVPWSLRGHSEESLRHLLSGDKMFVRTDDPPGGYELRGFDSMEKCTPSHPTYVFKFIVDNGLVGDTPRATVGRTLDWCRANLTHFIGGMTAQNAENHWQYRGAPPVRRIIEGTPLLDPANPGNVPAPKHWTAGCVGTSAFLRAVLRTVNLPVILRWRGSEGHTLPHFAGIGRSLSHGDDPYNGYAKADYPAEKLLIDENTFESWFPHDPNASAAQKAADLATCSANIGRRVVDLAVWHIGDAMVFTYCQDKSSGATHANGKVFDIFEPHGYTVAQLEATDLWGRLDAEAQARGAC